MTWMSTSAAACILDCSIGDVAKIAAARKFPSRALNQYDVPVGDKVAEKMFRAAPVAAIMEHWRQWAVDVGLCSETDEIERLIRGCTPGPGAIASHEGEIVRLFGSRLLGGDSGAPAGTVLGSEGDELVLAADRGRIAVSKVRRSDGEKVAAMGAGIGFGVRLD